MLAFVSLLCGSIPNAVKFGAIGLVAGILVISGAYTYGKHEGRQQAAMDAIKAIAKAYKDRNHENATVDATDALHICLELGGVRDDCLASLRGLGKDQPETPVGGVSGKP